MYLFVNYVFESFFYIGSMWDNLVTYIKEITFIGELKSAIQILENLNSAHAEFAKPLYKILKCKFTLHCGVEQRE